MPLATRSRETFKCKLETVPGGFVELRKMSFGETLKRQEIVSNMSTRGQQDAKDRELEFKMQLEDSNTFVFGVSIVDHNLEDEAGRKLDFRSKMDVVMLDSAVGEEISELIDKLNTPEDMGPFLWQPTKDSNSEPKLIPVPQN